MIIQQQPVLSPSSLPLPPSLILSPTSPNDKEEDRDDETNRIVPLDIIGRDKDRLQWWEELLQNELDEVKEALANLDGH